MRLIEILNKIANGELKEGTKVIVPIFDDEYTYDECYELTDENGKKLFDTYNLYALNQEVELIEPEEPTDNTKIEELAVDETDINCLGIHSKTILLNIIDKLNEVIRYINK